jgi:hypothetical protein
MGFQNDKNEVVEQISTARVLNGLPEGKTFNSIDSVNSKSKNLLPYLMDVLSSSCLDNAKTLKDKARCEASRILIEILLEFLPVLAKIVKEGIIEGIKAGLCCGTDFTIPSPAPSFTSPVNNVDFNGMMKMDTNQPAASKMFGNPNTDFNLFLSNITSQPTPTTETWTQNGPSAQCTGCSGLLDVGFDPSTQNMTVAINNDRIGSSFHQFLLDYVNSVELFSKKTSLANIMDFMFGTISAELNISADIIFNQAQMDMAVEKILEVDVCADNLKLDNSFFEFSEDEKIKMQQEARNKSRGVNVLDLGCGLVEVAMPISVLDGTDDLDTAPPRLVKETMENTLSNVGKVIGEFGNREDAPTMQANFNTNAVLDFPKILTRMVLTPKITVLYQISHQTINDIVLNVSNGYDFSKAARTFFEFITREAAAALLEIVFNKVKDEVIKLIQQVITKIIKEKIQLYVGSISGIFLSIAESAVDSIGDAASQGIDSIDTPNTSSFV